MQRTQTLVVTGILGLALSAGCLSERDYTPGPDDLRPGDTFVEDRRNDPQVVSPDLLGRFVAAREGYLQGNVGPASNLDQVPDRLSVYDDGTFLSVESVAVQPGRAAMVLMSVYNAGDFFQPGNSATFTSDGWDINGTQLGLLGCTGQGIDIYDEYDMPASEVVVVVEEGARPGDVVVHTQGLWSDGSEANASFTLSRSGG
jgi:hypothetical protein